jgi:hypothetical protein
MSIQTVTRAIRLSIRSEALVAEIRLLTYARKVMLASLAFLAALIGFAFINLALFEYLQSLWGPIATPLAIGLGNIVFAALILLAAKLVKAGPELAMAEEIRSLSGNALESELQPRQIASGVLGALTNGNDASMVRLLVPTVVSIVSAMRRAKGRPKN